MPEKIDKALQETYSRIRELHNILDSNARLHQEIIEHSHRLLEAIERLITELHNAKKSDL